MDASGHRGEEVVGLMDQHDGGQHRDHTNDGLDARVEVWRGSDDGLSEVAVAAGRGSGNEKRCLRMIQEKLVVGCD